MANQVTSKKIVGDQITLFVTHDTANPSTDFTLAPALPQSAYQIIGFSFTNPPAGNLRMFSGSGGTASNEIWNYNFPGGANVDSTGIFINTGFNESLNIRSSVIIGTFTLVLKII